MTRLSLSLCVLAALSASAPGLAQAPAVAASTEQTNPALDNALKGAWRGAENVAAIDALATDGKIRPHLHAALDLADWREAFAMLERREVVGKVVLKP